MSRILLVLGLLLSFILLVGSMTSSRLEEPATAPEKSEKAPARTATDRKEPVFYPPVPGRLPDLHQGYVFNEARSLLDEKAQAAGAAAVVDTTLDDATYIGSVISGQRRVGIVAYTEKPTGPQQRTVVRGRPDMPGSQPGQSKHIQLAPGETFSGYTVAEVLPDRIVFKKNGRSLEKLLDVEKQRKQPPPLPAVRRAQQQGSRDRVITPRQVGQAVRVPPEPGRPTAGAEPAPIPPPMSPPPMPQPMSPPPPPGAVIQGSPHQIFPGGEQPGG